MNPKAFWLKASKMRPNLSKDPEILDVVTMVGALPPHKGNAYYSMSLAHHMAKRMSVDFIAFKTLYPEFLYPGGVSDDDAAFSISQTETLRIRRLISYANPFSWIRAGFAATGRIVHLQWWSIPLAPIYFVILSIFFIRKKQIVITVHNVVPHESSFFDKWATRVVLGFANSLIVHSENNRQTLVNNFGIERSIVHKVHMPVHDMYNGSDLNVSTAREAIGVPKNCQLILSFGNLRGYKGIDSLITAFASLCQSNARAHLVIVGQPWKNWGECELLIDKLEVRERVSTFLEYVPMSSVAKFFVSADIVVLPYKKFDAQSGVGNIAIAFDLPLIVTRVGGLPELVLDHRAIVDPDNPDELARSIAAVFEDESLLEKLQQDTKALKRILSWEEAIEETLAIYGYSVTTPR